MHTTPEAVIAILGMALVTIAVKASGLLLADRLPREGFAAAWLKHIPGAVLAALVAPALVTGSPAEVVAAVATGGIFILTRNLFAAMATGVVTVYLVRLLIAG
jgi:branched-subunit amino acid transport protein